MEVPDERRNDQIYSGQCIESGIGTFFYFLALSQFFYRESAGYWFLLTAVLSFVIGYLMVRKKPANTVFYLKEGCVTTALSWIMISLVAVCHFICQERFLHLQTRYLKRYPGFTTTGASILSDVECLSQSILFWRSFSHWIGGMGVLVFLLAIIPLSGGSHMNLMRAESRAICGQAGAKGTCDSAYSLFNLFRHDHCRADFPAYWQNAVS